MGGGQRGAGAVGEEGEAAATATVVIEEAELVRYSRPTEVITTGVIQRANHYLIREALVYMKSTGSTCVHEKLGKHLCT